MARINALKSLLLLLACAAASGGRAAAEEAPAAPAADPDGAAGCCPAAGCPAMAPGRAGPKNEWCCPKYWFCLEKPPHVKFAYACSKPVCDVCALEGYGYYATCWRPWAFPPDCRHCPTPPAAVLLGPGHGVPPPPPAGETLPPPKEPPDGPNR
jgi:hypothetical protein